MIYLYASLIGYLIGAFPSAFLIAKIFYRINIFDHGSKNMGSTNIYRTLGIIPFAATLAIDVLKGMGAILITAKLFYCPVAVFISAFFALFGHTFSFWVKFKGGKGVATGLGIFLALAINSALSSLFVFVLVLFITRMVSVSSVLAAASLPCFIGYYKELGSYNIYLTVFASVVAAFVIYKHKTNIIRVLSGKESKLSWFGKAKEVIE
ncbi:MAG: glycerol-3-phosphate 1-O-acyltransferase PlsY [Candidatus Riflebacteria bacterium]|nr:glycerol-3-phosphate 1-O-acyltransferase PlsY [Candidatus Riflebacteria bacterium]